MKRVLPGLFACAFALAACIGAPAPAPADDARLQDTVSLMVAIGQHGEGASMDTILELASRLDAQVAAAPNDPFVLKLVAQARRTLSDYSQDRALRVQLRQTALGELDRAIDVAGPSSASRVVMLNGQETEIDLKDLADLRGQLMHQVQTDR